MTLTRALGGALVLALVVTAPLTAQAPPPPPPPGGPGGPGMAGRFMLQPDGGPESLIKGIPYSAQATTEMIQTLADGNRIVRKTDGAVHRDGEGRVRREFAFTGIGPFFGSGPGDQGRAVVSISDPVAGVRYMLDPEKKKATRLRGLRAPRATADRPGQRSPFRGGKAPTPVRTALGTQVVEGLTCEGTRATVTVPAGQVGNEQPLEIVSERWFSPELQVTVMTRFLDPRVGERVYKLTNIVRGEPSPQLFEVPSDYTITDRALRQPRVKRERPR